MIEYIIAHLLLLRDWLDYHIFNKLGFTPTIFVVVAFVLLVVGLLKPPKV